MQQKEKERQALALRGGMRGKFLRTVSALQEGLETIKATEAGAKNPVQYLTLKPLFENMQEQVQIIQQFGMQTAEAALGSMLRQSLNPRTLDLREYLNEFRTFSMEELSLYAKNGQLLDKKEKSDNLIVRVDPTCLSTMLVSLISGIMQINPKADTTVYCTQERRLVYCDSSTRLSESESALLQEGKIYNETVSRSDLSLLLVHAYAEEIGWMVTVTQESGLIVAFSIPDLLPDSDTLMLRSEILESPEDEDVEKTESWEYPDESGECRTLIREEFASLGWKQSL